MWTRINFETTSTLPRTHVTFFFSGERNTQFIKLTWSATNTIVKKKKKKKKNPLQNDHINDLSYYTLEIITTLDIGVSTCVYIAGYQWIISYPYMGIFSFKMRCFYMIIMHYFCIVCVVNKSMGCTSIIYSQWPQIEHYVISFSPIFSSLPATIISTTVNLQL